MKKDTNLNPAQPQNAESKLENFLAKNIKKILVGVIIIAVVIIAVCVGVYLNQKSVDKTFDALLDVEKQANELQLMDFTSAEYSSAKNDFLTAASALTAKDLKSYPAAKAELLKGDVYFIEGDFSAAVESYNKVADAQKSTYLGALAMMNAAACYEELGDNTSAFNLYEAVFNDYGTEGAFASKALFNTARLYEARGNIELAKATYEQLIGLYLTNGSEYAKLAQARLVSLD